MEFSYQYNGGNCGLCDWILAEGPIEDGATEKLKSFIAKGDYRTTNVRFNSPGGSVLEALKLGRFIRQSNFTTLVGEDFPIDRSNPEGYSTQKSECHSACVYAFAGGVRRFADDKSLGIHQFYRPDDALRPLDKRLSALDVANMQRLAATLNEYVRSMGVDPRLISMASAITPWDPIYRLSKAELGGLNLDTSPGQAESNGPANWQVQPAGNGAMAITNEMQDGTGRTASLAIMCRRSQPRGVILRLWVQDKSVDWSSVFSNLNDPTPQYYDVDLDGTTYKVDSQREATPIQPFGDGASLAFFVTHNELATIMKAKTATLNGFTSMAVQRVSGPFGGRFSMTGSSPVIRLALKNCVDQ
jgi:hypothetical protein